MPEATAPAKGLRRDAGVMGLLYASLGGIIGSGWLFGPWHAAQQAGPLSIISWILGGGAILLLAMVYAELATMFPRSGAVVHFPQLSHGSLLALIWSWILLFAYVSIAPAEVMAVLGYMNNLVPHWSMLNAKTQVLTPVGYVVAVVLMAVFTLFNLVGIRWVMHISNAAGWWKLGIPALAAVILIFAGRHTENLHVMAGTGTQAFQGIFTALATGGVIFSYFGFRGAIELAGESSNPHRNIPIAVIGSVLIGMALYIGLELAFLLAVNPTDLAQHGWKELAFSGQTGPFAALASILGIGWLATLLYIDAIVSPSGTGFIYTTTSSRIVMAMGEDKFIHPGLAIINKAGVPWLAVIFCFVVGLFFMLPFPSWQKIVSYITQVTEMSYGIGPIVLLTLRRLLPESKYRRPYRLAWAEFFGPFSFVVSNLIIYWGGIQALTWLVGLLLATFTVFIISRLRFGISGLTKLPWRTAWWVFPYLIGMWLITFFGDSNMVGGLGKIIFPYDVIVIAVFSLGIMWLALRAAIPVEELEAYIKRQGIGPAQLL
ncbi:MAG TPA: APC family permease [Phycisphaerae bacterium]|nr:APC family permease [Phycisphaerae bacterium]